VNSARLTWEESRQSCKKSGLGDLMSIESYAEWIFLKSIVLRLTINDEYLIGLRRRDDRHSEWRWVSNKSVSQRDLPWATGEPNGFGDCVSIYKDYQRDYGKYNDLECTRYLWPYNIISPGYICELPIDGCNRDGKSCTLYM